MIGADQHARAMRHDQTTQPISPLTATCAATISETRAIIAQRKHRTLTPSDFASRSPERKQIEAPAQSHQNAPPKRVGSAIIATFFPSAPTKEPSSQKTMIGSLASLARIFR